MWDGQEWDAQDYYKGTLGTLCGQTTARALNIQRGKDYKLRIRQTKTARTATVTLYQNYRNGCWYWKINGTTLHDEVFGCNLLAGYGIDRYINTTFDRVPLTEIHLRITVLPF